MGLGMKSKLYLCWFLMIFILSSCEVKPTIHGITLVENCQNQSQNDVKDNDDNDNRSDWDKMIDPYNYRATKEYRYKKDAEYRAEVRTEVLGLKDQPVDSIERCMIKFDDSPLILSLIDSVHQEMISKYTYEVIDKTSSLPLKEMLKRAKRGEHGITALIYNAEFRHRISAIAGFYRYKYILGNSDMECEVKCNNSIWTFGSFHAHCAGSTSWDAYYDEKMDKLSVYFYGDQVTFSE